MKLKITIKYLTMAALLFFSAPVHGRSYNVGRNPRQWELNPDGKQEDDQWSCNICKMSMLGFTKVLSTDITQNIMKEYVTKNICMAMLQNQKMCDGLVKQVGNYILNALAESLLQPQYFCEELSPACINSEFEFYSAPPEVDRIIFRKPPSIENNDFLNKLYAQIKDAAAKSGKPRKTIKAVHFSDPHVDPTFKVGADNACSDLLCCHYENGQPESTARQAKQWGDLNCDLPSLTFQSFIDVVKSEIKPDVVFWTGDN